MKKFLFAILMITACNKEYSTETAILKEPEVLNTEDFTKVEISSILSTLKPTTAFDYAELRLSAGQGPLGNELYSVMATAGDRSALNGTCLDLIKKLPVTESGFAEDCTPICNFNYVMAVQNNGEVKVINSIDGLKSYLGSIDSEDDAEILALANGYEFDYNNKDAAGVKKTSDGFDILCKKRVHDCHPIQYNRFWLHVSSDGNITIKEEIIYSTLDACI